ncbi:MAG: DUF429 domain-containing protein [Actinomycetes bacterium]
MPPATPPLDGPVVGVDGCRAGWIAATAELRNGRITVTDLRVHDDLSGLLDALSSQALLRMAIDIPIGLSDHASRMADTVTRRALGARRSSVFSAPVRAALDAPDHPIAVERSRAACGVGLSVQSWNLVPKIREADEAIRSLHPHQRDRVFETHPELCFAVLDGAPMRHPKRTLAGRRERLRVLHRSIEPGWTRPQRTPSGARGDDVLDALVLAVRATQWGSIGPEPVAFGDEIDRFGLRMRIHG